jgi:hypothetical protein
MVLLCWLSSRQPILPRPPSCAHRNPITLTPVTSGMQVTASVEYRLNEWRPSEDRCRFGHKHRLCRAAQAQPQFHIVHQLYCLPYRTRWHLMGANDARLELSGAATVVTPTWTIRRCTMRRHTARLLWMVRMDCLLDLHAVLIVAFTSRWKRLSG